MRIIGLFFAALFLVLGAFFTALNAQPVEINYFFGELNLPVAVVVLVPFILGFALAGLHFGFQAFLLKQRNKKLENRLKSAHQKVDKNEHLIRDIK